MKRIVLPLLLLLGAAPAIAQSDARHEAAERRIEVLTSKLGLDAATAAKVRATFQRSRAAMAPVRHDARQLRLAIQTELAAPSPDSAKLAQLTAKLSNARQQMQALRAQRMAELEKELTPRQYAQLLVSRGTFARGMHRHRRGTRHGDGATL